MTWLVALMAVALVVAFAAVTGIKPRGTRPVARTRMMGMARLALVAVLFILAFLFYRARAGV